jgi:transcriptional accessory protein Tex/SPT6
LDQTRIHYRQYEHVYKVVADCMDDDFSGDNDLANFKKQQAVIEIIKDPTKLKQFAMNEYKEQIKKLDSVGMAYIFD